MATGNFGPWAEGLPEAERIARWRGLRAAAMLLVGGSHPLVDALRAAETDADAAQRAFAELMQLPPLPRRRVLSCLAKLQEVPSAAERARARRSSTDVGITISYRSHKSAAFSARQPALVSELI